MKDFLEISDHFDQIKDLYGFRTLSQVESAISHVVQTLGEERFRHQVVTALGGIFSRTRIIPDAYQAYKRIFQDGLQLFLSKLPLQRLVEIVSFQILMDKDSTREERLVEIAKQIPTLHKLGQMIARNRYLDNRVREWLICLENGLYGTDGDALFDVIEASLGNDRARFHIRLDRRVLSEASVGVVVPFSWIEPESGAQKQGVFKVLKPDIGPRLEEELTALDILADYFDSHRQDYSFGRFRFRELFEDVKTALQEELNLPGEQINLAKAHSFYRKDKSVFVPSVAPFSSRHFTAMSFMHGTKVTDALTRKEDRKQAAHTLFRTVICAPLFSRQEHPIFHGDPHAGNIFSTGCSESGDVRITLLDWSQCGRLAKHWRIHILKFVQGIIRDDENMICNAVSALSKNGGDDPLYRRIQAAVRETAAMGAYSAAPLMKKTFIMIDRLSLQGIRFPKDLLLFRKTFFTLDGLLSDLDPEFDMDGAVMGYMRELLVQELPKRIAVLLSPMDDAPDRYRSLLSNKDLQMLFICYAIDIIKKNTDLMRGFFEINISLFGSLINLPTFFAARFAKILLGLYFLYKFERQ